MSKIYETKITNVGGREGESFSDDKSINLKIVAPSCTPNANAYNPEQLFAAGYSACFNSALSAVLSKHKLNFETSVVANVSLYNDGPLNYHLGVVLEVVINGADPKQALELAKEAHQVCPYSKAVKDNIEVELKVI